MPAHDGPKDEYARAEYGPKERAESESRERVLPTNHARAGIELHRMRYVLGFGIAGVVIAFLLAWYFLIRV